ncbi:M48 family metalloprotease [Rhodococcus sp. NPDC076796]|uniref:M48 family metalloprotease n=1 Tax=Rhodococcus sp. NPDC076796 TaxID=3154859 RepID=UPI00344C350D
MGLRSGGNATAQPAELTRRKTLCENTIRDICARTVASTDGGGPAQNPRPTPALHFTERRGGYYRWKANRIEIGEKYLGEPSRTDDEIRALIGHELGHWADPDLVRACRLGGTALALTVPLGLAVMFSIVFSALGVALSMFAILTFVMCVLTPWASWGSEFYADQFAVRAVGSEAVVELLGSLGSRFPSPTHPSPARRVAHARTARV